MQKRRHLNPMNIVMVASRTRDTPCLVWGGAGVWWPGRSIEDQPLHSNEVSCAVHAWHPDGLALWGGVFGPMSDSTRTEIAAGLLALSGPGPVHSASDSLNFVRDATSILKEVGHRRIKPWSLMPNGDLWAIFDEHATHKREACHQGHLG